MWRSFVKVQGFVLGISSFIFAYLLVCFGENQTILLDHKAIAGTFVVIVFCFLAFLTVVDMLIGARTTPKIVEEAPRVLKVITSQTSGSALSLIMTVNDRDLFTQDTVVSVYHGEPVQSNSNEIHLIFLGLGRISNVQEKVRWITVLNTVGDQTEYWKRIFGGEKSALRALVIKPLIMFSEMENSNA